MRNEWSSRISAMLDIIVEDDERVSPYVCYKCTHRLSLLEKAIEDRKAFRELAISSLKCTDEEENQRNKCRYWRSPDTVRLRPSAKFSRKRLVFECNYDHASHDTQIIAPQRSSPSPPLHFSCRPCMPSPQESPLEQLSSPSVQLPCPAARLPLASASRPVVSYSDIPPRQNVVVSNFKCV